MPCGNQLRPIDPVGHLATGGVERGVLAVSLDHAIFSAVITSLAVGDLVVPIVVERLRGRGLVVRLPVREATNEPRLPLLTRIFVLAIASGEVLHLIEEVGVVMHLGIRHRPAVADSQRRPIGSIHQLGLVTRNGFFEEGNLLVHSANHGLVGSSLPDAIFNIALMLTGQVVDLATPGLKVITKTAYHTFLDRALPATNRSGNGRNDQGIGWITIGIILKISNPSDCSVKFDPEPVNLVLETTGLSAEVGKRSPSLITVRRGFMKLSNDASIATPLRCDGGLVVAFQALDATFEDDLITLQPNDDVLERLTSLLHLSPITLGLS